MPKSQAQDQKDQKSSKNSSNSTQAKPLKYNHRTVEKKWQKKWREENLYRTSESKDKPKYYVLDMFPYPSGAGLHVGHPKGYIATDIFARMKTMQGYNVLHPMGWDAFGLPAENFALKNKVHPRVSNDKNIKTFKKQLGKLGFSYDWEREISTTDPEFYKWTQWIFLQLFKKGLAYVSHEPINWCPSCQTGLANEDLEGGKCERCGSDIERRPMQQWVLKITDYAERMLQDLDKLPEWEESIKEMQKNWIGKSEGAQIKFQILNSKFKNPPPSMATAKQGNFKDSNKKITRDQHSDYIEVFTTRPDTLWGATYMVVAPEHEMLENWKDQIENWQEVAEYIEKAKNKSDLERQESKEKTGIKLEGVTAINPVNQEELPIFVADYVLAGYGTGAIMAVPAHDERDWEFAQKFDLPIRQVVAPLFEASKEGKEDEQHTVREDKETVDRRVVYGLVKDPNTGKYLMIDWKVYDQTKTWVIGGVEEGESLEEAARREIEEETGYYDLEFKGQLGGEIHKKFFAKHKDENRYGRSRCVYFELKSPQQKKLNSKEQAKHLPGWYSEKEVSKLLTFNHQRHFWKLLQNQESECFAGEGVSVNSGILNDLKTPEAKEKVIQWLEEQGLGKRAINYKIKDWVFSRQRYWGEPIPMVWCKNCALEAGNEKDEKLEVGRGESEVGSERSKRDGRRVKVLMIHGFEAWGGANWFPSLKKKLEGLGCEVFNPDLPNSKHPKVEEWQAALNPYLEKLDENSVIIGHSLGSKTALDLLSRTDKKINQVFLVASAIGNPRRDWNKMKQNPVWRGSDLEALQNFWQQPIDWKSANKSITGKTYIIFSQDDPHIDPEHYKVAELENVTIEKWQNHGHFSVLKDEKLEAYILEQIKTEAKPVPVPVPEEQLPVKLPEVKHYEPTGTGESPLAGIENWVNTKCPVCGGDAKRETNTMPQWAGSSWYYLRFIDPHNKQALVDKQKEKYWSPVDFYVGGAEHATRHLIYARFWHKFLYDIGAVNYPEPFTRLQHVGLILAEDGRKMSKRWGNVINPDDIVEEFGADAMRVYEMFMGPFSQPCAWSTNGLIGSRKFLEKVVKVSNEVFKNSEAKTGPEMERLLHQTIKKVGEDIEHFKLNTAISQMMILVNKISEDGISKSDFEKLVQILAPFGPHLAEELWERLGRADSIFKQTWPKFDAGKLIEESFELVVQINGKLRARLTVPQDITQEEAQELAQKEERVQKFIEGKQIRKVIFVPGKLLNLVI